MALSGSNLLTSLDKWAWRQEENFLSEAFAHLLQHLKRHEPKTAATMLSHLVRKQFHIDETLVRSADIMTQVRLSNGKRPDLRIENQVDGYLLYVEVKHRHKDNPVALRNKLACYIEDFRQPQLKRTHNRRVVLISRYAQPPAALPTGNQYFAGQVQWYQIADILRQRPLLSGDTITTFLVNEFVNLLEEKGMTLEQVKSDLGPGAKSVAHLFDLIEHALKTGNFSPEPEAPKDNYGTYLGYKGRGRHRSFTVGFRLRDASKLWFEIENPKSRSVLPEGWVEIEEGWIGTGLDLETKDFFSAPINDQCNLIVEFVQQSLEDLRNTPSRRAHKISRVKESPPPRP